MRTDRRDIIILRRRLGVLLAVLIELFVVTSLAPAALGAETKVEAEDMTLTRYNGGIVRVISNPYASGGEEVMFARNGAASKSFDGAASKVVVRARGDQCQGAPLMNIYVDGSRVGQFFVSNTTYADFGFQLNVGPGTHALKIEFANNYHGANRCDRDLFVDYFVLTQPDPAPPPPPPSGTVTGALVKWQPVTITFAGPSSTETSSSPNPFLDYRLQVTFTSPSGKSMEVPGFYDGGSNWKVKFNPDESGTWRYRASFRQGANVAIVTSATAGAPTSFDGASGNFDIAARDASAPGFLSQGELEYVGGYYLKFRDGSYFLKGGADSPENWLGYAGFDNTPTARHTFSPHVQDWQSGDPVFNTSSADGGKGFIGALNYLSAQGVNSIYFLPMNIGGDGQDSSPYVSVANWAGSAANDNYHFDVSKLSQWDQAFAHAQKKGIMLHFVLNEAEAANKLELDGATLGPERKLFYREMVARFGYYNALQWNISEEYDLNLNLGSDTVKSFADYVQSIDPYDHPITVHQSADPDLTWTPFLGDSRFSTTSFQYFNSYAGYGAEVEEWRQKSSSAGRPLPIAMDELTPATTTNSADMRKGVLWPTYLSGGNLEWYIGSEDQSLEDFRRYAPLWQDTNRARTFMQENLPFWQMQPADGLLSGESTNYGGGQVFAKSGDTYAIYLPNATSTGSLDLSSAPGTFEMKWFNPRSGSFEGTPQTVAGGTTLNLGAPPSTSSEDWVVLLKFTSSTPPPSGPPPGNPSEVMRADDFVNSIGVNTHFSFTFDPTYDNYQQITTLLKDANIRWVRDHVYYEPGHPNDAERNRRFSYLGANGIHVSCIADDRFAGMNPITVTKIDYIETNTGGACRAYEGQNEPDLRSDWTHDLVVNYQRDLFNATNGVPSAASKPVIGPSIVRASSTSVLNGDLDPYVDRGNMHPYFQDRYPAMSEDNMSTRLTAARNLTPSHPLWSTENGWSTEASESWSKVNENVQSKYILRDYFWGLFDARFSRMFTYAMVNEDTSTTYNEDNFGLVRADLSPKPSYNSVKRLLGLLAEPGAPSFTPQPLSYTLSGAPSSLKAYQLQKSNGTHYLVLYQDVAAWNPSTSSEITNPRVSVTLNLGSPASRVTVYEPHSSATPVADYADPISSVDVSVPDHPVVVEIVH